MVVYGRFQGKMGVYGRFMVGLWSNFHRFFELSLGRFGGKPIVKRIVETHGCEMVYGRKCFHGNHFHRPDAFLSGGATL